MRIFSPLSCSDENLSGVGSYAIADVTPRAAAKLLRLHDLCRVHMAQLEAEDLASEVFDTSYGSGLAQFVAYQHCDEMEKLEAKAKGTDGVALLEDDFKFEIEADEGMVDRVECFRVAVGQKSVGFSALSKYGSYRLTTRSIPVAVLAKIAATGPDGGR